MVSRKMIVKEFKLRSPQNKQFFKVKIFNSLKALRTYATTMDAKTGAAPMDHSLSVGVTATFKRYKIFSDGTKKMLDWIGTIMLCDKHAATQVVCHEVVHAALHQYRLTLEDGIANFGDGCNDSEEDFAHIYDLLFRDMVRKLHKHKIWD